MLKTARRPRGDETSAEASTNESHSARPGKKMTYSYRKDRLGQQANWSRVPVLGAMEHGLNSACCKEKQGRTPWWQVEP